MNPVHQCVGQPISAATDGATDIGSLADLLGTPALQLGPDGGDPLNPNGRFTSHGYCAEGPSCTDALNHPQALCSRDPLTELAAVSTRIHTSGTPYKVSDGVRCGTFGTSGWTDEEWIEAAKAELEASRWSQMAYEMWTGEQAQAQAWANHYLTDTTCLVKDGVALEPRDALRFGVAQMRRKKKGGIVVVHVPLEGVDVLGSAGLLRPPQAGDRAYRTWSGAYVATDEGYVGTGPAGAPPLVGDEFWMAFSGPITARWGPVIPNQVNRASGKILNNEGKSFANEFKFTASRMGLATWLCEPCMVRVKPCCCQ